MVPRIVRANAMETVVGQSSGASSSAVGSIAGAAEPNGDSQSPRAVSALQSERSPLTQSGHRASVSSEVVDPIVDLIALGNFAENDLLGLNTHDAQLLLDAIQQVGHYRRVH